MLAGAYVGPASVFDLELDPALVADLAAPSTSGAPTASPLLILLAQQLWPEYCSFVSDTLTAFEKVHL